MSAPAGTCWRSSAHHGDGFPVTGGNAVTLYHEGDRPSTRCWKRSAPRKHHVHIQFFIFRPTSRAGGSSTRCASVPGAGSRCGFLYDSVGSYNLPSRSLLTQLTEAQAGRSRRFCRSLNPFYRLRVNLRNHRKILVVDGRVGFTGGLNIGDEYLGMHPKFGNWRDTHFRVEGPAVEGLQQSVPRRLALRHRARRFTAATTTPTFGKPPGDVARAGRALRPGRGIQGDPRNVLRRRS